MKFHRAQLAVMKDMAGKSHVLLFLHLHWVYFSHK